MAGRVTDFSVTLRGGGKETIYVGGLYKEDSAEAARVALRMSMARMFMEDQPLPNMKHGT